MTAPSPVLQTILFLASNPDGLRQVGRELRDIEERLGLSKYRERFNLEERFAVRPKDIQRALLKDSPSIVHFAGNGTGEAGLIFEDEVGNPKLVDGAALAGLFELFADNIRCVVLNGCYSEPQAKAISQHIDYVVGMRQEISSDAALEFAVGFYDGLGAGRDVEFAFKLGCSAIQMQGLAEHLTPVLVQKPQPVDLAQPTAGTGTTNKLWRVPELPPHFLSRTELLKPLKQEVLGNSQQPVVMTGASQRIGVQGMGGNWQIGLGSGFGTGDGGAAGIPGRHFLGNGGD
jgi:CHAT domain